MEFHDKLKNKKQFDLEEQTLSADDIEAASKTRTSRNGGIMLTAIDLIYRIAA